MKECRSSALDKASKLTLGISVYRGLLDDTLRSTSAEALASQDPDLKSALQEDRKSASAALPNVARHIEEIY